VDPDVVLPRPLEFDPERRSLYLTVLPALGTLVLALGRVVDARDGRAVDVRVGEVRVGTGRV